MTSTILELSQTEAQTVNTNGDYNISLPESQSTQKIIIKDDIVAELAFYQYYIYSREDELVVYNPNTVSPTPVIPIIDADPYIICRDISKGSNFTHLTEFELKNHTPIYLSIYYELTYTNTRGELASKKIVQ